MQRQTLPDAFDADVQPHTDTRLASQIHLVPTALDLLGLPEHTCCMGRSVLHPYPDVRRAFIATYQKPSSLTPDQLVVPSPGRQIEDWRLDARQEIAAPVRQPDARVARAIGVCQETARRSPAARETPG